MSAISIVQPALVIAGLPSGAMKSFSVDSDGHVVRMSLAIFDQPGEAEFCRALHHGYAFVRRNATSR